MSLKYLRLIFCVLIFFPGPFLLAQEDVPQELSLEQDRKELDQLRQDVPEDIKKKNDDLAFILGLFKDKNRKPGRIKSEFNRVYNRLRNKKQKEFKKERDQFTKSEKKKRKEFLATAKKKRKAFLADKPESDARKEFFANEMILGIS